MTKIGAFVLFLLLVCLSSIQAETCRVRISDRINFHPNNNVEEITTFLSMNFELNQSSIAALDSNSITVPINNIGFDTLIYSFLDQHGLTVCDTTICKLKANEMYTIGPCTCCGIFLMTPSKNAARGSVKFLNESSDEFIAMVGSFEYDTIPRLTQTDFIPSEISMNCGYRPNRIFFASFDYIDEKYQYENLKDRPLLEKNSLREEQESHVVYEFTYLFLHEEELIVSIGKEKKYFTVDLGR